MILQREREGRTSFPSTPQIIPEGFNVHAGLHWVDSTFTLPMQHFGDFPSDSNTHHFSFNKDQIKRQPEKCRHRTRSTKVLPLPPPPRKAATQQQGQQRARAGRAAAGAGHGAGLSPGPPEEPAPGRRWAGRRGLPAEARLTAPGRCGRCRPGSQAGAGTEAGSAGARSAQLPRAASLGLHPEAAAPLTHRPGPMRGEVPLPSPPGAASSSPRPAPPASPPPPPPPDKGAGAAVAVRWYWGGGER